MEKKDKKESEKKQIVLTEEERKKFYKLYEKMAYSGKIEEPKTLIQKIKDWIG